MATNPYQDRPADESKQYGGYTGYYTPPSHNSPSSAQPDSQQTDATYQYGQQQQQSQYSSSQQQQYQTYQPPLSTSSRATENNDPTAAGMKANNAAILSYAFIFLSGFVFFILERKNRFVRFCAAQSFLFFGAVAIVYILLRLIWGLFGLIPLVGGFLGFILSPIFWGAIAILLFLSVLTWLFLMIQAYRGVKVRLPYFGKHAERLVARFTK